MSDKRLFDYLYDQLREHPLERAFGSKVNGAWRYYPTTQMVEWVNRASLGLLRLGLKPGDKVASVVYQAHPQWVALDYAMLQIGVLHVPMYPTISTREYEYILNESEALYCFVGEGDLFDKVMTAKQHTPALKEVFTFYDRPDTRRWDAILAPADADFSEVERIKSTVKPDDLATLIYTSGTTGNPKGVMLTHRNIVFNVEALRRLAPISPGDRILSFLPVSHVYERVAVYAFTAYGGSISFTGTDNLGGDAGDLRAIRPHFFTCVPRLLEKVYERIYSKGMELHGLKRAVFFWALQLTDHWDFNFKPKGFTALQWWIADRLIFSKWREALGGHVRGMTTAASACPLKVLRTFNAAGIRVREGYGLSEAAPALTLNEFDEINAMLGTVGPAMEGVELRFVPDPDYRPGEGEILATSPGIMAGYYKQPEKTAEVIRIIDGVRWLVTGDVGMLVEGPGGRKFLKITDRKKELLKTSGGKYVAPTPIESVFKEHRLVEQAMVVGENLKFVSALLVPSEEGLKEWCKKHGIAWTNLPDMIRNPKVVERYQMLVDRVNAFFSHVEQVKKFTLLPDQWEQVKADGSEGELTPTLKLKRRVIMKKFEKEIEEMYR
ncbi:MAG TPA: long-chain fatty acid--CoA ligase [Saprospiraceae bacterium]|nr:long-chain fatty acid--CoA ligase [Saprospiraceae bacterium]